jgi:hypothetical protein
MACEYSPNAMRIMPYVRPSSHHVSVYYLPPVQHTCSSRPWSPRAGLEVRELGLGEWLSAQRYGWSNQTQTGALITLSSISNHTPYVCLAKRVLV